MKMYKDNNSDFDLEREYVVNVKKRGYTIDQLGSAIRLLERFEKLGINMEQIESLFDKTAENCFKRGIEPEDFIKMVFDVCDLSKTKVPVEELSSDIEKKKNEVFLKMDIIMMKIERKKVMHGYDITETKAELANVTRERDDAITLLNRINDRLDDFILIPRSHENHIRN
jgi:hypothetical protein